MAKNKSQKTFSEKVYQIVRRVPKGKVTTYKAVAESLGTRAYRAVGTALNKNPYAPKVPCHRVVNSNGYVGGFAGGASKKISMLRKEGISINSGKIKDFKNFIFAFKK